MNIWELKTIADRFEHCGDYGETFLNLKKNKIITVLGDGDEEFPNEIKIFAENNNIGFDVENEYYPEGKDWILVSKGVETYIDESEWDDEICDFKVKEKVKNFIPLTLDEYAVLYLKSRA